jgi:ParG protein
MSSTGSWGQKPSRKIQTQPTSRAALDAFVNSKKAKGATKRLNADIPAALHARVKAGCALEGRDITEVLIELLEARFPTIK